MRFSNSQTKPSCMFSRTLNALASAVTVSLCPSIAGRYIARRSVPWALTQTRCVLKLRFLRRYHERFKACIPASPQWYQTVGELLYSRSRSLRGNPLPNPSDTSPAVTNVVCARSYIPCKRHVDLNYTLPNGADFTCVFPALFRRRASTSSRSTV